MSRLKGVCVGAGYFSRFQYEAWNRIPEVEITAMCNRNAERAQAIQDEYGVAAALHRLSRDAGARSGRTLWT